MSIRIKNIYILIFSFLFLTSYFMIHNSVFVLADENIAVTGTVPPKENDFQLDLSSTDGKTNVSQKETLSYKITYGAQSSAGFTSTNTIIADFNSNVVDYVIGSADNGYGGAVPVIDLNNKTITWTINLPKNTLNQTINFSIKTNSNNTTSNAVSFAVKGTMTNQYVSMPDKTINQTYKYDASLVTPTPTLTPTPTSEPKATSTPAPNTTTTPTITPTPTPATGLQFTDVTFRDVSDISSVISVSTNLPTKLQVRYGNSAGNLSDSISTDSFSKSNSVTLKNLTSQKAYFFQVTARDAKGNKITSDIFTFNTAKESEKPKLDTTSVLITSSDVVIFAADSKNTTTPSVVLPQESVYSFRFKLDNYESIKKIEAVVRNKVLGITSSDDNENQINTNNVTIINRGNGYFEGRLKTPQNPGSYEIFARVWDTNGNLTENKLTEVNVAPPLTILDDKGNPVEKAQVLLYFQNSKTKEYQILSPEVFPIKNPNYTDTNGQVKIPLPNGNYKIQITAIGYKTKEIKFSIIGFKTSSYPKITLEKEPFNLITLATYYFTIIQDGAQLTRLYIQGLSESLRFFELNALIVTAMFVFLTIFAFSRRIHIPLRFIFEYFKHLAKIQSVQKKMGNFITGRTFDAENGQVLPQATIYLLNQKTGNILGSTISDKDGNFRFIKHPDISYALQVMKQDFEPATFFESKIDEVGLGGYQLQIQKHHRSIKLAEKIKIFSEKILSVLFETLLIIALIFELSFGFSLGFLKVLPFLAISVTNLALWLIHLSHLKNQRNIF